MIKQTVEELLKTVDYEEDPGYTPSNFALEFVNFIKLVNGAEGEENETPVLHYKMLDNVASQKKNIANMLFRGASKSTIFGDYLFLYLAVFGSIPNFGRVEFAIYVSDSMDHGVKNMRRSLEYRRERSVFLMDYIPHIRFTDNRWEFINKEGNKLIVKGYGARTGVRGARELGKRPCHEKGTVITTELGTHLVEDYPGAYQQIDNGYTVALRGLTDVETVSTNHKYWCRTIDLIKYKKELPHGSKSTTTYVFNTPEWIEINQFAHRKLLGKQTYRNYWIGEEIDYTCLPPQDIWYTTKIISKRSATGQIISHEPINIKKPHPCFTEKDFWWLYGLWLADGHRAPTKVGWTIANTERYTVGKKVETILKKLNYTWHTKDKPGCYQLDISDTALSSWLKETKRGKSLKDMPLWVLRLDLDKQKQLLLGYIAGDGYINYKDNQIRINSINLVVLKQLGKIAARLGLPYHIRNTKRAGRSQFPNGQICNTSHQWEFRLRQNVKTILGFAIKDNPQVMQEVLIKDGYVWRRFKNKIVVSNKTFVPITTPTHSYSSVFGKSHNCLAVLDDLINEDDAKSDTLLAYIEEVVYSAINFALHPTHSKVIWNGTPFNSRDPLYKAIESGAWHANVFPICEEFPCEKKDFKGAWEDRFPYNYVKGEHEKAVALGTTHNFNQELMLQIMAEEDRLILDQDIMWFKRSILMENKGAFNFYITTDFAVSETTGSDYSVILVWALNHNSDWFLVDGIIKKQLMNNNIDDLFRMVSIYKPQQVGIEISGQQAGFIRWIYDEMLKRNIYFSFATKNNKNNPGIRPLTDKMQRFNLVVPWFKTRKMWFPEELKDSDMLQEILTELRLISAKGIKSKYDDGIDAISQLPALQYFTPSEEISLNQEQETPRNGNSIWGLEDVTPKPGFSSYIV